MTQFVTVDRATLEQALEALEDTTGLPSTDARSFDNRIMSIRALRAALANAEPKKAEDMAHRRLGTNGGVPYNEQLAISKRWDRAVDAGSPITAFRRKPKPARVIPPKDEK